MQRWGFRRLGNQMFVFRESSHIIRPVEGSGICLPCGTSSSKSATLRDGQGNWFNRETDYQQHIASSPACVGGMGIALLRRRCDG